ncbi:MAG: IS110 family transposase [Armatimonadetes bacterium]|nr:IS110 family transposase [Armatimonadota bacterium]
MAKAPQRGQRGRAALPTVNPHAAGIDIGGETHYVAVPADCDPEPVRTFAAFTGDLYRLADWLRACGVETVAMESTGVYWIPVFQVLEERGFEVKLVDARQLKRVPGRKSDVADCQWLQQLHSYGLLAGAFRPADEICVLRSYLRQRAMLVRGVGQHVQHMQKALVQMNVQLQYVLSDITGATGLRIIRAILEGERDPQRLAALRDPGCTHPATVIARALEGDWREEHLFALRQALTLVEAYEAQIAACDARIQAHLQTFPDQSAGQPLPRGKPRRADRHDLHFDATAELFRLTGVDLTRVKGLEAHTVLKVLSETGLDMTKWLSAKHFGSWLGLAPNNRVSGGKVLSRRTLPTANRAAAALRVAAQALHHSHSALGAFLRRKAAQRGMPKAITATAYKLARILYSMLLHGLPYVERGQDYYETAYQERVVKNLARRAQDLGYTLVKHDPPAPNPALGAA